MFRNLRDTTHNQAKSTYTLRKWRALRSPQGTLRYVEMINSVSDLEELLSEVDHRAQSVHIAKRCEWCNRLLPSNGRYQLKICHRCRKESIVAFKKNDDQNIAKRTFSMTYETDTN
jgi:hypothetical protein